MHNYQPTKIIVGARGTQQRGWTTLEKSQLDITRREDWQRLFAPGSLDAVLAEHVLEHLTPEQILQTLENAFIYLKPNGYFRIAVPDGFNPDKIYLENVRPGNVWNGDDHKVLLTIENLTPLLLCAGFIVNPLEFYDRNGRFYKQPFSHNDGLIYRCFNGTWSKLTAWFIGCKNYTSLIVDAIKQ